MISAALPAKDCRTYGSRQDAISGVERMAYEHFEDRREAKGDGSGQVRRQARIILAQLEQRAKPKQMEMFT